MPAQRRSFKDALEPVLYWDTTFAIAFFVETERYHTECVEFYQRLDCEGILSVVSDFVYNELAFHLIRAALAAEGRRTGQHWLDVKKAHPDLIAAVIPDVETKKMELDQMTLDLPISEDIKEQAFHLMRDYGLLPTDSYHIATALDAGVEAFITLDEDFLRVEEIIVYTCLP